MKQFNLNYFSKYRQYLMGASILSIMIFHYGESVDLAIKSGQWSSDQMNIFTTLLAFLGRGMGSIGVEVFLFLSGIGLYYSFSKNESLKEFYKKRCLRVLIPYFVFAIVFLILKDIIVLDKSFQYYLFDLFGIQFIRKGERLFWYIYLILVLYVAYPLLYKLFKTNRKKRYVRLCIFTVVYIGFLYLLRVNFHYFPRYEIALCRVLIFVIGCGMAQDIKEGLCISSIYMIGIFVLGIFARVYLNFMPHGNLTSRMLAIPFSFTFMLVFICIFMLIDRYNIKSKLLLVSGDYSLELYLTHVSFRRVFGYIGYGIENIYYYCIVLIISVVVSYFYRIATNKIIKLIQ